MLINKDVWDSLPAEYQVVLLEESDRLITYLTTEGALERNGELATLTSKGMEGITLPIDEVQRFEKLMPTLWEKLAEEGDYSKLLAKVRALLNR